MPTKPTIPAERSWKYATACLCLDKIEASLKTEIGEQFKIDFDTDLVYDPEDRVTRRKLRPLKYQVVTENLIGHGQVHFTHCPFCGRPND